MIISHQHRFVFAAIPKTGTHSVRQALRAHLGADDLEQVGLFVNKRFPFEELAQIKHGHISLRAGPAVPGRGGVRETISSSPSCVIRSTASSPTAHS